MPAAAGDPPVAAACCPTQNAVAPAHAGPPAALVTPAGSATTVGSLRASSPQCGQISKVGSDQALHAAQGTASQLVHAGQRFQLGWMCLEQAGHVGPTPDSTSATAMRCDRSSAALTPGRATR